MNKQCKECGRSCINGGSCSTTDEGFVCEIHTNTNQGQRKSDLKIAELTEALKRLKERNERCERNL